MQNGKHGAVAGWIQELVGVPARGERSRLGLAIAHHATNEQVRIVECGAVSVSKGVSKFAAFVNGTRRRTWILPCSRLRRSEEHTSELQSHSDLVCRLLLEKKKK